MRKISKSHSNRRRYNWLSYDISDSFLKKYVGFYKGTMYDLGCGESPYKDFFLQYVKEYVGVDWTDSHHQFNADITADLNKVLPISPEVADVVISLSVLEHLCEPQLMLHQVNRILKPGGAVVLQVPWQWWVHEAPHDYFRYTPYGLEYMLRKAGFDSVVVEPQAGYFTTAVLKWNYFTNRFVRGPKVIRWLLGSFFRPMWYIGQRLAPLLDKLDGNWIAEAPGYYVTARKP